MAIAAQMRGLKAAVASSCRILTDSESAEFQEYAKRWSDIDRQVPAAIVLPMTEEDVQKTVIPRSMSAVSGLTCHTGSMGGTGVPTVCDPERRP